ncbi:MAG: LysM peptidoglycan-binding domain-containing protein [Planctomycetota bacterium]|nr:LysM peptidoglycan-binding domain-containing protein [Planctomycetota bacterium]
MRYSRKYSGVRHVPIWQQVVLSLAAVTISGCRPMWYGPPPPTMPPGHGFPSSQFQQPTLVPANPAPLRVPDQQVPGRMPPSTFQKNSPAGSLTNVPDAAVGQVLTVPTPKSTSTYHDVQAGETLTSIARKFGVTVEALKTANVFDNDPVLQPGQVILIP